MSDRMVLALQAVVDDFTPYPGSQLIVAGCGHPAWIAPAGQRYLRENLFTTDTICVSCLDPDDVEQTMVIPGTQAELEQVFGGKDAVQKIRVHFDQRFFAGELHKTKPLEDT